MRDNFHFVAKRAVLAGHHCKRHESGAIYRQWKTSRVEPCYMQTTGAHGFDLRGVGLHRKKLHVAAGDFLHMFKEFEPDFSVLGWIFNRRKGKDQSLWIKPARLIIRR